MSQIGGGAAMCVWASQAEAQHAAVLPLHSAAARLVAEMYVSYRLERYRLRKAPGSSQVTLTPCAHVADPTEAAPQQDAG